GHGLENEGHRAQSLARSPRAPRWTFARHARRRIADVKRQPPRPGEPRQRCVRAVGLRTARTLPLVALPQKNRSLPSASSPLTVMHAARLGVHLLDPVFGDLPEMFAVESGPSVGRDIELPHQLSACRVDGGELFALGEPDVAAVPGDAVDLLDARERAIFADDLRALRCLGSGRGLHGRVRVNAPAAPRVATRLSRIRRAAARPSAESARDPPDAPPWIRRGREGRAAPSADSRRWRTRA